MKDTTYEALPENLDEPATKADMAKLMKAFESLFEQMGITLVTVTETKDDIKEIKTNIAELQSDVAKLKTDVAKLQTDVSPLRTELHSVREDIKRLDAKIEAIGKNRKEDADALTEEFLSLKSELTGLARRVKKLETLGQHS